MIGNKWDSLLTTEYNKDYFKNLMDFVKQEYKTKTIYPKQSDVFNAFRYTDFDDVKVVILGQDPYHGENEAHGLSFSVLPGVKRPPSLNNMFKELNDDLGIVRTQNTLTDWTQQGVMMLNSIMTVVKDKPLSHKGIGWEIFTDTIIQKLNEREDPVIFVLWGGYARSKKALITNRRHFIIEAAHPSPLSAHRGFFGSKPYSKINTILKRLGKEEIDWSGNYHKEDS